MTHLYEYVLFQRLDRTSMSVQLRYKKTRQKT